MRYKLVIANEKRWLKDCKVIPSSQLQKIFSAIEALRTVPWSTTVHTKKLQHYLAADYRLRVGEYRVLFFKQGENATIILTRILHRSKLY